MRWFSRGTSARAFGRMGFELIRVSCKHATAFAFTIGPIPASGRFNISICRRTGQFTDIMMENMEGFCGKRRNS